MLQATICHATWAAASEICSDLLQASDLQLYKRIAESWELFSTGTSLSLLQIPGPLEQEPTWHLRRAGTPSNIDSDPFSLDSFTQSSQIELVFPVSSLRLLEFAGREMTIHAEDDTAYRTMFPTLLETQSFDVEYQIKLGQGEADPTASHDNSPAGTSICAA